MRRDCVWSKKIWRQADAAEMKLSAEEIRAGKHAMNENIDKLNRKRTLRRQRHRRLQEQGLLFPRQGGADRCAVVDPKTDWKNNACR